MDEQLKALQISLEVGAQRADAEGIEFWFARDLQVPLGYARWENFQTAIQRAMQSCETSGNVVSDHFRGVTKLIVHGKGGSGKLIEDRMPHIWSSVANPRVSNVAADCLHHALARDTSPNAFTMKAGSSPASSSAASM